MMVVVVVVGGSLSLHDEQLSGKNVRAAGIEPAISRVWGVRPNH